MPLARYSEAVLPTEFGEFTMVVFRDDENQEHFALVKGELPKENVLTRVHSECLTGEVLHSHKCDCRQQLQASLICIQENGSGVLVYLRQEGRGIGLGDKIRAYALQSKGMDTVDSNRELGLKDDARTYEHAASILKELGIHSVALMTNNPDKISGLTKHGINVARIPFVVDAHELGKAYVKTKQDRMGHLK